jgi:uncharacterized protein YabE (DUF348 family)
MRKRFRTYKRKYEIAQRTQVQKFRKIRRHPFLSPIILFIVLFGAFLAFAFSSKGQSIVAPDTRIVIISHDGVKETVPTKATTVGSLIHRLQIKINPGDVVEPSESTAITQDDFRINIYRAQPVEIIDGSQHIFSFSAATTPRAIAQQAGETVYPEDDLNIVPTQNFLTDQAIGERIVINRATPINVNIFGAQTVIRTHDKTVGQLLADKNIVLAGGDSVVPDPSTPITPATQIFLVHKGTQIITTQQAITMPTQVIEDGSLAYGTSAVRQQGSNGVEVNTYQLNLVNGVETGRTLLQSVVTQQPVTQIVAQGTSLSGIKGDMALAGISATDYQYADYIISHESGWCTTKAQGEHDCPVVPDDSSTPDGYGLCQATPGSKMASAGSDWATNPITQLKWCSGYAQRYGGWFGSYQHWLADHSW